MHAPAERAGDVRVQLRRAMQRQSDVVRIAKRIDLQQARDAAATRAVCLKYIDRARFEHATKVERVVSVLASGDGHARRSVVAQKTQAFEVIGRYRLFEPDHVFFFGEAMGERACLLSSVGTVGVDEELDGRRRSMS